MRRLFKPALPLLLFFGFLLRLDSLCAQTHTSIAIDVASDGTCVAAGFHVSCSEIGEKLREAGIPKDTSFTFHGAPTVSFDAIKSTISSLTRAGFDNVKIGFITEPARY